MRRMHLIELEDQSWFPALIRDCGTDFLRFASTRLDQTANLVPILRDLMQRSGTSHIVDLCSGGGGPIELLADRLTGSASPVRVTLTDFYPNLPAFERVRQDSDGTIEFETEAVDAKRVPERLRGLRTMFNSFHHFRPADARAILEDAVRSRQPIAIGELVDRSPLVMLGIVFNALIGLLFITPFIRPFRWSRLLFTYLVPIVPLFVLWDGLVSCMRVYSPAELDELCEGLAGDDWVWQSGSVANSFGPTSITYLTGRPA